MSRISKIILKVGSQSSMVLGVVLAGKLRDVEHGIYFTRETLTFFH